MASAGTWVTPTGARISKRSIRPTSSLRTRARTQAARDALLAPGQEAQWCLFDSIVSVIHGRQFARRTSRGDQANAARSLRLQTEYLNRALGQLTAREEGKAELQIPEAYYLRQGVYVPNDHTPLLWAQANLALALRQMEATTAMVEPAGGQ